MVSALVLLVACGGKKTSGEEAAAADSTDVKATAVADSVKTVAEEATAEEEDDMDELVFAPDLKNDKPLNLSDVKDDVEKYIAYWDDSFYEVDEEEGVIRYDISLGYDRPLQQLCEVLPGKPADKKEVGRMILIDLNGDKHTDVLVCLGHYGVNKDLYYDAYLWNEEYYVFNFVENFRQIPNPGIDRKTSDITSHIGSDREVWQWKGKGKTKIKKKVETQERD